MKKDPLDILKDFAEQENKLTEMEFISPVFRNRVVATRIKGVIYTFNILVLDPGWYVFKPVDSENAKKERDAEYNEIQNYLKKLPIIRMVTSYKINNSYYGVPQNNRFGLDSNGLLPILLVDDEVLDFESVICRYDGVNIWFDSSDFKNDMSKGEYLRESYANALSSEKIKYSGLNISEKIAYSIRFSMDKQLRKAMEKKDLKSAVSHAGGDFVSYRELKDNFLITYKVDGQQYTSSVSKDSSYNVISAGICLSGDDNKFDLKSLVGVIREGQNRDLIYRESV